MPILASDLRWYGSASMPDDDVPTNIGGAIDLTKKVEFIDNSGLNQAVSSAAGDTTQTITVHFVNLSGVLTSEVKTLTGLTPVAFVANMARLEKAIKSATTTGDVCVEAQTAERSNTAQAGSADTITLDAGASAVDNFYQGMVIRLTGGTGSGQIRQIIAYVGATKVAQVDHAWSTNPDATTTFRIAKGIVFEKSPAEIFEVRRPFYNSAADVPGGVTKTYYDKVFAKNAHATLSLTTSVVKEFADPSGNLAFGLAATVNDTGGNGGGNNRQVAPAGVTFASTDVSVPGGGTLAAGDRIGTWLRLTLAPGALAANSSVTMRLTGFTS